MMDVKIYQINLDRDEDGVAFISHGNLSKYQERPDVDASLYDKVFEGEIEAEDLEDIYRMFNIGTEELAHVEMVSAIVSQLTRNLKVEDLAKGGFDAYYVDHTTGVYPVDATGNPFTAATFQSTGDPIADLHEDLAADGTTA